MVLMFHLLNYCLVENHQIAEILVKQEDCIEINLSWFQTPPARSNN